MVANVPSPSSDRPPCFDPHSRRPTGVPAAPSPSRSPAVRVQYRRRHRHSIASPTESAQFPPALEIDVHPAVGVGSGETNFSVAIKSKPLRWKAVRGQGDGSGSCLESAIAIAQQVGPRPGSRSSIASRSSLPSRFTSARTPPFSAGRRHNLIALGPERRCRRRCSSHTSTVAGARKHGRATSSLPSPFTSSHQNWS